MSKEELTTKMHSEFSVSPELDNRNKAFAALSSMKDFGYSLSKASTVFDISEATISKYEEEYNSLLPA